MFPEWPILRQTPGENGAWGEYKFYLNESQLIAAYKKGEMFMMASWKKRQPGAQRKIPY